MPRYKLVVEYDGTSFVGWQRQPNGRSVQEAIEQAIEAFTGETVAVRGAGRTDTGVHALGQVAHANLGRDWPAGRVRDALNAHLRPEPVAVLSTERVPEAFDARFSAVCRRYRYRIVTRRAPLALERNRAWHVSRPLDAEAMHRAAQALVGRHDFTTFRAAECQARSPLKTLDRLDVRREGALVLIETQARSFLHSQVRSMVGSLKLVGEGKWPEHQVGEALRRRDRAACGPLAPPYGLYLVGVDYPETLEASEPVHELAEDEAEEQVE
jgi:tRNA pseudouridine38-40 synthase